MLHQELTIAIFAVETNWKHDKHYDNRKTHRGVY